jgi:hypothetical protein
MAEEDPFDFGVDPSIEEIDSIPSDARVAVIRTSDRMLFKRCRRRWGWSSHLRGNLTTRESISPLWFGSGFHYAMEDFHGYKRHNHPVDAFKAYVKATYNHAKAERRQLPFDWPELTKLGIGMIEYYADTWLVARPELQTYWHKGVPQVEVHALVEVPITTPHYDKVLYAVTLDRVVTDEKGNLYILDYKTAKRIQTGFFQTDPQISAYCWIGSQLYGRRIDGFIYQQHRKDIPHVPDFLSSSGKFSTAKSQNTTHQMYRKSLKGMYGDVMKAPKANVDFLNWLAEQEDQTFDKFILRDKVFSNEHQAQAEGAKLMLELEDMLNPDLPLYPNPIRECGHMCSFNNACVSLDDGGDWQAELEMAFVQKDANFDSWRNYLPEEYK